MKKHSYPPAPPPWIYTFWAAFAVAFLFMAGGAWGANRTWSGSGGDNNWGTAGNWNVLPVANDAVIFGGTDTRTSPANNFPLDTQFNGISFNSAAAASFTISGNRIILNGNIGLSTTTDFPQTLNLPLKLNGDRTITVAAGDLATLNGMISDDGSARTFTKTGAGQLNLNSDNSAFLGSMILDGGTLKIGHDSALGSAQFKLSAAATVATDGDRVVPNSIFLQTGASLTVDAGGKLEFQGAMTLGGNRTIVVNNERLTVASIGESAVSNLTKQGVGDLVVSGNVANTGNITITTGTLAVVGTTSPSGHLQLGAGTTTGVIATNGTFSRPTGAATVPTAVHWGGIGGGFAGFGSNATWGHADNTLTVNLGGATATVKFGAANFVASADTLVLGATSANGPVIFQNPIDLNNGARAFTVARSATAAVADVDAEISGAISAANPATGSVVKKGAGTLKLTGSSTYTGATVVEDGVLVVGTVNTLATSQPLGKGSVTLGAAAASSGTLRYTGSAAALVHPINILGNGSDTLENAGTGELTYSGTLTKNGTIATLKGGSNGIKVTGTITGSSATDLVVGTGITTFSGATLTNNNTIVASGGTLRGDGNSGSGNTLTVQSGGKVDPGLGANTAGTFVMSGNVTLASGGTFAADIGASSSDKLDVTGSVTVTGATLTLTKVSADTLTSGTDITLIHCTGGTVNGTFSGYPEGSLVPISGSGLSGKITYVGGSDVKIKLVASKLAFGVQPPASSVYGNALSPAVTVRVLDGNDALDTADNTTSITLTFGANPTSAVLGGTVTRTVINGVATFDDLTVSKVGTGYSLSASSSPPLTGATSDSFNITKATPMATLIVTNTPQTFTGSPQAATVGINVSSTPGTVTNILTGGSATQTNAGTYPVTADFVPNDTDNYNTATGLSAGNFVINKATPTATLTVTNSPQYHDGSAKSAIVGIVTSTPTGGAVTNILTGGASSQSAVGDYAVTADYVPADTTNYNTLPGLSAGTFSIVLMPVHNITKGTYYTTIQAAINAAGTGGETIEVAAGTYNEDVVIDKAGLIITGAGMNSTTILGTKAAPNTATVLINAGGVTFQGFKVTRDGNNVTDWNNNLNLTGLQIGQKLTPTVIVQDNWITGNRNGILSQQGKNQIVRRNIIESNRTGIQLGYDNSGMVIENNFIRNNHTAGILYLTGDTTSDTAFTAAPAIIRGNSITGNWAGGVVNRRTTLPTGALNLSGNWFGTTEPVTSTVNNASYEIPYNSDSANIPVEFGGNASWNPLNTSPPDIVDVDGLTHIDFTPLLMVGTDTDLGTNGFQGDFSKLLVHTAGPQSGTTGRIQEGVTLVDVSGTVNVAAGTYVEKVYIGAPKSGVKLLGPNAGIAYDGARVAEAIIQGDGTTSAPSYQGNITLAAGSGTVDGFRMEMTTTVNLGYGIRVITASNTVANNIIVGPGAAAQGYGIQVNELVADGNLIKGNKVSNFKNSTNGHGINIGGPPAPTNTVIRDNEFSGNFNGIYIDRAAGTQVIGNIVKDNLRHGISDAPLYSNQVSFIHRNTITGNNAGPAHNGAGLSLYGSQATVTENFIADDYLAVWIRPNEAYQPPTLAANPTIFNNSITGSIPRLVAAANSASPYFGSHNASGNWWGTNVPATVSASVSGTVDFTPLLYTGTDTEPGTQGFQGDFSGLVVTYDGAQTGPKTREQEATDLLSPGGTIYQAEIAVEQPLGMDLLDGVATRDFGSTYEEVPTSLTFTIKNVGNDTLTGLGISFDGVNAGDFSVGTAPTAPVSGGNSTTFTVHFAPTGLGPRSAVLHIASNDGDENPFDIALTGMGIHRPVHNTNTDLYYVTITAAVNDPQTEPGHVIEVAAGTYSEGVNVNKRLTIRGAQFGVDARAGRVGANETIVTFAGGAFALAADGIVLDGLVIQGQTNGNAGPGWGYSVYMTPGYTGRQVRNCIIQDNIVGLALANTAAQQAVIQNNLFRNNNNVGSSSGQGIYQDEYTAGAAVENVLIDSNKFEGHDDSGIGFSSQTAAKPAQNITVSNNVFSGNGRALYTFNVKSSSIINNTMAGATAASTADIRVFEGCSNLTITGNDLQNGAGYALRVNDLGSGAPVSSTITFTGNRITNYGVANPVANDGYTGVFNASANYWGTSDPTVVATLVRGSLDFSPLLENNESVANQSVIGFQADLSAVKVHSLGTQFAAAARLQEGVNLVDANGTVDVAAGNYNEQLTIAKAGVQLKGANAGIHPVVGAFTNVTVGARGAESILSHNGFFAIKPAAANLTIDGFKFTGTGSRVIDCSGVSVPNLHIANNIFTNTGTGASTGVIQLVGGTDMTNIVLEFNSFANRGGAASFYTGGLTANFAGLRVANNYFNGAQESVFWAATALVDGVIENNEFDGTISAVSGAGLGLLNIGQAGNIQIRENYFHDMQYTAFQVGIVGGAVLRNTFVNISALSGGPFGDVFQLWGGEYGTSISTNVTIANNFITFNQYNTANGPIRGIRLRGPNVPNGPAIDGTTIHVNNNSIVDGGAIANGTASAILHQGDPTKPVDASGNWWGTNVPATVATKMSGPVDFTPMLFTGTDIQPATTGFQGDFSGVIVTYLGEQTGGQTRRAEAEGLVTGGGTVYEAEIAVEQPVLSDVGDGGTRDFGNISLGGHSDLVFTIKNEGNFPLTGLGITIDGAHSADYTLFASPTAPVSGSDSTTFTVRFAPSALGSRSAALHIASDDGDENPYDISLTGKGINNPPTFTIAGNQSVAEDSGPHTVTDFLTDVSVGPPLESGQTILSRTVISTDHPEYFTALDLTGSGTANGNLTYTLAPNAYGVAHLTVTVKDSGGVDNGGGDESSQNFTITITPVNDAPTFVIGEPQEVKEDSGIAGAHTVANFLTNISVGPANEAAGLAPEDQPVGYVGQTIVSRTIVSTDHPELFTDLSLTGTGTGNGDLNYTLAPNAYGVANVRITVTDSGTGANSSYQDFTITVLSVNDAPTFSLGSNEVVDEDTGLHTVNGFLSDISVGPANEVAEPQSIISRLISNDNEDLFAIQPALSGTGTGDGNLTYTLKPDAYGVATVTVTLKDDGGTDNGGVNETSHQFTITVRPVNDAPSFVKGADQTSNEDVAVTDLSWATDISVGPPNESTETPTFHVSNDNNPLFAVQPSVSADGKLSYTPAPDAYGRATVTVYVQDDGGVLYGGVDRSPDQSFTITIAPVNDAPTFVLGTGQVVNEDTGAHSVADFLTVVTVGPANEAVGFTPEPFGFEGQTIVSRTVTNDNNGMFSVQPYLSGSGTANGTLNYTIADNATGVATVTVKVTDSGPNGGADVNFGEHTFTITVRNLPEVVTLAATDVKQARATLNATVDPQGGPFPTAATFQYGLDPELADAEETPVIQTPATVYNSGVVPQPQSNVISGLKSGATYYFRSIAMNPFGVVVGDIQSFTTPPDQWTWVGGSKGTNATGSYFFIGAEDPSNQPPSRQGAASWNAGGRYWVFGGVSPTSTGNKLNDLWSYGPTQDDQSVSGWKWHSGSQTVNQLGVYSASGVFNDTNTPGARHTSIYWTDASGKLWLFGGFGVSGRHNDLWCFNPALGANGQWAFIKGGPAPDQVGVYGTKGVAAAANRPGGRQGGVGWTDSDGTFWLWGGAGSALVSNTTPIVMNDLWNYNPATGWWTWVGGPNVTADPGSFSAQGVAAPGNLPSARRDAIGWVDRAGTFWLFGGQNAFAGTGFLNDLWKYNRTTGNWTWVKGGTVSPDNPFAVNQTSVTGDPGVPNAANTPGARSAGGPITMPDGSLYMFGGMSSATVFYNELWKFDWVTQNWSYIRGTSSYAIYGTQGVGAEANTPGNRFTPSVFADASNEAIWEFGGGGLAQSASGRLNDFWRLDFSPSAQIIPDSDNDGLDDVWEVKYFSNLTAQTGTDDADTDGFSNATEEAAGTDPTNSSSKPSFVRDTSGGVPFVTITPTRTGVIYYLDAGNPAAPISKSKLPVGQNNVILDTTQQLLTSPGFGVQLEDTTTALPPP